ncbi:predicted protein [Sclerotinia sclerotiorum 1980 UF-70]|uniref:Uncharacterized protein n=1 Tax=Sclerotinia sclerotiorum (strain ATCC 18683 / 1980 / Ss-1) TaxID=665079 RepID=A7F844_SCLS1|nr:predicted protein [Sclerotinia sclerotiorum 1980 UF-70]EDN98915.1 predicted protein [Sclerotinia sclerotiorum 1980 UF-70]
MRFQVPVLLIGEKKCHIGVNIDINIGWNLV